MKIINMIPHHLRDDARQLYAVGLLIADNNDVDSALIDEIRVILKTITSDDLQLLCTNHYEQCIAAAFQTHTVVGDSVRNRDVMAMICCAIAAQHGSRIVMARLEAFIHVITDVGHFPAITRHDILEWYQDLMDHIELAY